MPRADYEEGYNAGFQAGFQQAREQYAHEILYLRGKFAANPFARPVWTPCAECRHRLACETRKECLRAT